MTRGMILGSGVAGWLALAVVWAVPAVGQETGAPTKATRGAVVYFHNIRDGKRIPQKFTVRLGLKEMGIAPAAVV